MQHNVMLQTTEQPTATIQGKLLLKAEQCQHFSDCVDVLEKSRSVTDGRLSCVCV